MLPTTFYGEPEPTIDFQGTFVSFPGSISEVEVEVIWASLIF